MAKDSLVSLRKGEGLTQAEMASVLGVSNSFYSKIEAGDREPSREFLRKVKEKFPLCDMNIFFASKSHEACGIQE